MDDNTQTTPVVTDPNVTVTDQPVAPVVTPTPVSSVEPVSTKVPMPEASVPPVDVPAEIPAEAPTAEVSADTTTGVTQ